MRGCRPPGRTAAEHRAEEIAEPAEPAVVEVLEPERLRAGRPVPSGDAGLRAAASLAPPPKPPNAPSWRIWSYCFRFSASPKT